MARGSEDISIIPEVTGLVCKAQVVKSLILPILVPLVKVKIALIKQLKQKFYIDIGYVDNLNL